MSSEPAIAVRNVDKVYRAYDYPLHALLARTTGGRFGRHKEFRALQDISFEVRRGESVGIVGRNGSGKSTLLQLICGIRQPTSGSVTVVGRVSALLELGSGFHPDFTGSENVYMQGAIIGLTRREMEDRFDRIAAFADIGEHLEQPIKTYSTGMVVRLAFAVAISIDPEILVVDEALAVGDAPFQVKCMNRMQELIDSGVTMLFVSHNAYQIQRMCSRAIYLAGGTMSLDGTTIDVLARYESELAGDMMMPRKSSTLNSSFRFLDVRCKTSGEGGDQILTRMSAGQPFAITIRYELDIDMPQGLQIGLLLKCIDGARIFGEMSSQAGLGLPADRGRHAVRVTFEPNLLLAGNYTVSVSAFDKNYIEQYGFIDYALSLRIDTSDANPILCIGSVVLPHDWTVDD